MYSGGERGGGEEPDRPGRPAQRERHSQQQNNPPTETQPTEPATTEQPNKHAAEPEQPTGNSNPPPRLRTTRPGHSQQDKPPTRPAHPLRKELQPTGQPPTNSNHHPTEGRPEPGTAAHQAGGAGVKEGSKGSRPPHATAPTTPEPGPTNQTPPPTRHPNPKPQPQPETKHQSQDPHHPPAASPPTPHQVPCTHAMGHIQPTSTLANKLEQTQEASPRKSKLQMRRPRPSHHPTTHQWRGTREGTPVAPPGMHHARNRRRPHHRRRQPRTK